MDWRATIYFGRRRLKFEDWNEVDLTKGRHLVIKMEPVRRRQEGKPACKKPMGWQPT